MHVRADTRLPVSSAVVVAVAEPESEMAVSTARRVPHRTETARETRDRHLRAWRLRGQPEKPPRQEGRAVCEARILLAHQSGDLMLGGGCD